MYEVNQWFVTVNTKHISPAVLSNWHGILIQCKKVRDSLVAQMVKNKPAMPETWVQSLGQEDPWRKDRLPTLVFLGFPGGSAGKESIRLPCGSSGPEGGHGNPLQYSCLKNFMDRGAWWITVHGVAKSQTRLSD